MSTGPWVLREGRRPPPNRPRPRDHRYQTPARCRNHQDPPGTAEGAPRRQQQDGGDDGGHSEADDLPRPTQGCVGDRLHGAGAGGGGGLELLSEGARAVEDQPPHVGDGVVPQVMPEVGGDVVDRVAVGASDQAKGAVDGQGSPTAGAREGLSFVRLSEGEGGVIDPVLVGHDPHQARAPRQALGVGDVASARGGGDVAPLLDLDQHGGAIRVVERDASPQPYREGPGRLRSAFEWCGRGGWALGRGSPRRRTPRRGGRRRYSWPAP